MLFLKLLHFEGQIICSASLFRQFPVKLLDLILKYGNVLCVSNCTLGLCIPVGFQNKLVCLGKNFHIIYIFKDKISTGYIMHQSGSQMVSFCMLVSEELL